MMTFNSYITKFQSHGKKIGFAKTKHVLVLSMKKGETQVQRTNLWDWLVGIDNGRKRSGTFSGELSGLCGKRAIWFGVVMPLVVYILVLCNCTTLACVKWIVQLQDFFGIFLSSICITYGIYVGRWIFRIK